MLLLNVFRVSIELSNHWLDDSNKPHKVFNAAKNTFCVLSSSIGGLIELTNENPWNNLSTMKMDE